MTRIASTKSTSATSAPAKPAAPEIAVIGIDIGKYTFHAVGLDRRGSIVLRQSSRAVSWPPGSPIRRRA